MIAQAVSPAIAPDSAGRYDLAAFIRGNGRVYRTSNSWASDEIMWSQSVNGITRQRKNGHWEEIGITPADIRRGGDTSPGKNEVYILTNPDDTPGSIWSPRYMKPGDTFKRTAKVQFRDMATGAPKTSYTDVTWLNFVRFHPTWTSRTGFVVPNVIELEAHSDHLGTMGAMFERYWYGHDLGLVGWQGGPSMSMLMGIAAMLENPVLPAPVVLPWYNGLTLPKSLISPADVRFKRHTLKAAGAGAFNVRSAPKAPADNILTTIKPDVVTDCDAIPRALLTDAERATTTDGDKVWAVVKIDGVVGYVRSDAGTVAVYVPPVEPPPPAPPDDERIKDTIAKLRQINLHAQECSRQAQELYTLTAIVLSAWEKLENQPIGDNT